ncbi:hypothetical protein SprV_0802582100 [Sparganum proliferum]
MHMINAVGLCDGENNLLQGNLTEVEVADANESLVEVFPRLRSRENKMLSCVIPDLQPNSTYNVTLKTCTQEGVCSVYGESLNVRTRPSVPRHVTVAHRTNGAFRIFWVWSFEDVNGQYTYKVKAVEFGGSKAHTCESLPADNSSSCLVANLTRGTKYKVAVSACTSDKYCSAYTRSVVGETLPNPPRNPSLVKASRTILTTKFLPPEDDKWPSFIYAGIYEAIGDVNFYRSGCETKNPMKRPYCEGHWLSPATKYNFRTFACTRKSFLCSEGQSTVVETTEPKPNRIYVARLENGSAYASWRSTMRRADEEQLEFRVSINKKYKKGLRVPIREGDFNHTFNRLKARHSYKFLLKACNGTVCHLLNKEFFTGFFAGVKVTQPTVITQTTAFVNWTVLNGWYGYTDYGFVYAMPVDEELGQQQCVGVGRNYCTLQNLRPDAEYSVVVKVCYDLGYCAAPTQPLKFRTAKPDYLATPSDVQVNNVKTTSFSLTWKQPLASRRNSFEYKVSLLAPADSKIPERHLPCAAVASFGRVSCVIENVDTNVSYSVALTACATADMCSEPTAPISVKSENKANIADGGMKFTQGYSARAKVTKSPNEVRDQTLPPSKPTANIVNKEIRLPQGNSIGAKITKDANKIRDKVLPPAKPIASVVDEELRSAHGHPTGAEIAKGVYDVGEWDLPDAKPTETILKLLNSLAKEIDQATITPTDPTCQLMIRVAFSKLDVAEIGDIENVFVVITPVSGGSQSEGPTWKTRSRHPAELDKAPQLAGGTYVDPINGSWQIRLSMPQAPLASKLPDKDVLIGSDLGNITDGQDFNGPLASGTEFAILFRVYTDLGIGTTPSKILSTEGKQSKMRASGGLVAVAVIFTVLCGVLIGLVSVFVSILRSLMFEITEGTKGELGKIIWGF